MMVSDFSHLLHQVDVLSLDIFDTLLGRRCARPEDVFVILGSELVTKYGDTFRSFADARRIAEDRARALAWERRQAEDTHLDEIYEVLVDLNPTWAAWAEALPLAEMDLERRLLYALPDGKAMVAQANAAGKRIIFVSDMYLPKAFCEQMLRQNGYENFEAIYVSSQSGLLKNTGNLFAQVIKNLGISARRILHVGDNPHADGVRAREHGMQTFLVKKATDHIDRFPRNPWKTQLTAAARTPRESLLVGLSARGCVYEVIARDPFWYRIGYQIAGPLLHGYVRFIVEKVRNRGIKKIFFLSRDGYILKRLYEKLTAGVPECPIPVYLYASRRALNFAAITKLDERSERWLAEGVKLNVGQFLHRIGLNPQDHEEAIRAAGFRNAEHPVVEGQEYGWLRDLYRLIFPSIREAAAAERTVYSDYLREAGVLEANPLILIDVGWMTSIQHSLAHIIRSTGVDPVIEGYYLGTYREAFYRADERSTHRHYLLNYGKPDSAFHTVRHGVGLLEFLFAAPEPTFLRMTRNSDGCLAPEFASLHENENDLQALGQIHAGAEEYVKEMLNAVPCPGLEIQPAEVMNLLHRLLVQPTSEEAVHLGDLCYADGYGAFFNHTHMARPATLRRLGISKHRWKEDFYRSHWPRGYYERLHPVRRWLLRRLHPNMKFEKGFGG